MIHQEMDIDHEWVFLPENGILEFNQDGEKKVHGGGRRSTISSDTNLVFLTDYFNKEQPPPQSGNSRRAKQVVPVPFPLEPRLFKAPPRTELSQDPDMIHDEKVKQPDAVGSVLEADNKEVKTQVSFRKPSYTNESVDMTKKLDSPKSTTARGSVINPQLDAVGTFSFDDKSEVLDNKMMINSPRKKDLVEKQQAVDDHQNKEEVSNWEENSGGLNLWKLSLTGIGAICSFGVAAATFCFIVLGTQHRHSQQQQKQKLLFQRYSDDKRMKQVVHHATRLNDAISAARGVPITRAHITFGGYYDGI